MKAKSKYELEKQKSSCRGRSPFRNCRSPSSQYSKSHGGMMYNLAKRRSTSQNNPPCPSHILATGKLSQGLYKVPISIQSPTMRKIATVNGVRILPRSKRIASTNTPLSSHIFARTTIPNPNVT
eukprot:IDg3442t1